MPIPKRVLHVSVDPLFGDDILAGGAQALNPNGAASFSWCTPVIPPRPHQVMNSFGQVLLHAPHPFRTITAAVDYIVATNPGATQPLPAPPGPVWEHAIVHLMPGLYSAGGNQTFGAPANGETFPIFLPPNVSVQGASALNTTLVLSNGNSPAFQFGVNHFFTSANRTVAINGENCFIDGVTITGGVAVVSSQSSREALCGVWVSGDVASRPTITNTVFYGLWVGVGANLVPGIEHDGLTLANNTFAWNRIGVWNGVDTAPRGQIEVGRSKINILNCLFDATPWSPTSLCAPSWAGSVRGGSQDFEGVSWEDMRVLVAGVAQDTNAWELGKHSSQLQFFQNLPATAPRATTPTAPRVDLSPYTGALGQNSPMGVRGNLFVRDLLCRNEFVAGVIGFDSSPHDFRLSPNVAPAHNATLQPLAALNPLVDAGFSDAGFTGTGQIVFENGYTLYQPPGFLPLGASQWSWTFHAWMNDLEGYGNPRISDHPEYPNPPFGTAPGDTIDIGADEVGQLIIAGYREGTTELRSEVLQTVANHRCWYLGPISGANPPSGLAADYRTLPSLSASAWPASAYPVVPTWHTPQLRSFSDPIPTAVLPQLGQPLSIIYPATMADVTPHLLPDIHPWWGVAWNIGNPSGVPPALTLWEECLGANHNASLYFDPTSGRINPPAAAEGTLSGYTWLDGRSYFLATTPAGVDSFGSWSGFLVITNFDGFCRGQQLGSPVVDVVTNPSTIPLGSAGASTLRFSLEIVNNALLFPMPSNLQTLTVWNDTPSAR